MESGSSFHRHDHAAQRWAHVSDEEKEKFFAERGMSVSDDGGAWFLHRADGWTVTLGNPQDRHNALTIAYDLIMDPPMTHEEHAAFDVALKESENKDKDIWNRQRTWIAKRF